MKTEELQIGNWVKVKPNGSLIQVAAIHHKKIGYHATQSRLAWVRIGLLEPIKVTPEILEKNGFTLNTCTLLGAKTFSAYELKEESFTFWVDFKECEYGCLCSQVVKDYGETEKRLTLVGIPYMHQLQNAMGLCGITKKIIL